MRINVVMTEEEVRRSLMETDGNSLAARIAPFISEGETITEAELVEMGRAAWVKSLERKHETFWQRVKRAWGVLRGKEQI